MKLFSIGKAKSMSPQALHKMAPNSIHLAGNALRVKTITASSKMGDAFSKKPHE
ncbi:hypothetical protein GCHA_1978 [Paraglaciecola chathamensis S18K6]|uniref:Uncharacterized protein n=2 Tax=Paraglaciecola chathamensis TaxID=368405 RepID=A0ABQ0I8E6_9ALTE|nr:hypothetical protein GAGA_2810 [Paraglaciecola agarilytica NO2]GAC09929.1 hypothetical protein GCHA_1978 [Paraglaciecola chathamensis S18K6]